MRLKFIEVNRINNEHVKNIFNILKYSGEHLYIEKGLSHWRAPYPKESIISDIENKKVVIVKELETGEYVHTFQLNIINRKDGSRIAEIGKFATKPELSGKGIGTNSIEYIEQYCLKKNIKKVKLDVYDKSLDAICFYKSKGFKKVGSKKTKHFRVLIMEKKIIN